jgi:hypothetical protein
VKSSIQRKMKGGEKPKCFMVGNAQWVEWFVEKATAGRNLGSTALAQELNRPVLV